MPWPSIIMFVLSFLLSKSSGRSTAKSALIGAAAGLATYYAADPANPNNLFKIGVSDDPTATSATQDVAPSSGKTYASGGWSDVAGKLVTSTGGVLQSWGATGTAAVIGTGALAASGVISKYWPWLLVGAVFILRR